MALRFTHVHIYIVIYEASRGAGTQSVTVKLTGCGFDPHSRKRNIYLHLYFRGERTVLTLGSLFRRFRLPCCVRETSWS